MNEAELIEEAKHCETCLDWHHHCKAECCMTVYINTFPGVLKNAEKFLILKKLLTKDMQWYFKLRGVRYNHGLLYFPTENCIDVGDKIIFIKPCRLLEDNKCKGHPDSKPEFCKSLTLESKKTENVVITPNCLFRYKPLEDDNHEKNKETTQGK